METVMTTKQLLDWLKGAVAVVQVVQDCELRRPEAEAAVAQKKAELDRLTTLNEGLQAKLEAGVARIEREHREYAERLAQELETERAKLTRLKGEVAEADAQLENLKKDASKILGFLASQNR